MWIMANVKFWQTRSRNTQNYIDVWNIFNIFCSVMHIHHPAKLGTVWGIHDSFPQGYLAKFYLFLLKKNSMGITHVITSNIIYRLVYGQPCWNLVNKAASGPGVGLNKALKISESITASVTLWQQDTQAPFYRSACAIFSPLLLAVVSNTRPWT